MMSCDLFVILDDVLHSRGAITNKNKIKGPEGAKLLSVPLAQKKVFIKDVTIKNESNWHLSHWGSLQSCYARAPYWKEYKDLFLPVYENPVSKLSESNLKIIQIIRELLNIKTPMVKVSEFPDIEGKKGTKIVNICKFFGRGTSACLGLAPAVTMMKRNLKEINCPWFTRTLNTPFIRSSGVTSYPICPRWTFSLTVGLRAGIICPGR